MFPGKFLVAAALLATQVFAAAEPRSTSAAVVEKLVVIKTEDTPSGPLVVYGLAEGVAAVAAAAAAAPNGDLSALACGTNDVVCDGANVPSSQACVNLINVLTSNGNTLLAPDARSLCQFTNGFQCCVSWASNVSGLHIRDLLSAANKTFGSCVANGRSGKTRNTNLNGVCTVQCLSNRPDGCQ